MKRMKSMWVFVVVLSVLMMAIYVGVWAKGGVIVTQPSLSSSGLVIGTSTTTSATFQLWRSEGGADTREFPTRLSIAWTATAITSDSINVLSAMDLSANGTNWFTWSGVTDAAVEKGTIDGVDEVLSDVPLGTMPMVQYARLRFTGRAAAGDSVTVGNLYVTRDYSDE